MTPLRLKGRVVAAAAGMLIWISALSALCLQQFSLPEALPADADATAFSSERALKHLPRIASAAHPSGSDQQKKVQAYLETALRESGYTPTLDEARVEWEERTVPITNILVRLRGTDPEGAVLLLAHYDSVTEGPGALDDGTGVVTLLETLRALKAGTRPAQDVIGLFTDGEEIGLLGASHFVKNHPWKNEVRIAINLEAVSDTPAFLVETSPGNLRLMETYFQSAPLPYGNSSLVEIYRHLDYDTDLSPLLRASIPGLNLFTVEAYREYHTKDEIPSMANPRTVQHLGDQALALARAFAASDLSYSDSRDAVYFNIWGSVTARYSTVWAAPLAAIPSTIFLAILILLVRSGTSTWRGVFFGAFSLLLLLPVLLIAVPLLWRILLAPDPATLKFSPHFPGDEMHLIGLAFAVFCGATAWVPAVLRKISATDAAAASLFLWMLLTAATAVASPGVSYLFFWPFLFGVLVFSRLALRSSSIGGPAVDLAVWLLASLPGILLLTPFVYVVYLGAAMDLLSVLLLPVALFSGLQYSLLIGYLFTFFRSRTSDPIT